MTTKFPPGRISLFVKPGSSKTEILGFDKTVQAYRMHVKSLPEKGKANQEIVKFFRKEYKLQTEIVSGFTSRRKVLKIC